MNFLKATTIDGSTQLFNVDKILTIQQENDNTTKIVMAQNFFSRVSTSSIEWVACFNELMASLQHNDTDNTGDFIIVSNDFEYTGGGVWVLFSELYLPSEEVTIYASTAENNCYFYNTKEDWDNCENPFYAVDSEYIDNADPKYRDVTRALFNHFDMRMAKVNG